jgi:Concanavalin A-like lectin/glucanases superfamily
MQYVPPFGPPGTIQPDASYINGDPTISRKGSIPPAEAIEHPQREIVNLIVDALQSPSEDDLHQTTRAVRDGKLNFCIDSGPLNQLQVDLPGPLIQSYTAGLTLNVLIAHTNTGPTRISVGSLNPTTVKRPDGSELAAGDLLAGMVALLICDGTYFQCINIGTGETGAPNTSIFKIDIPYVHDTGTVANHVIGAYSPPLDDIREGRTVEVKLANAVTGPTDFTPNNFPTHPVAHPDGTPIKAGDGVINQIWLLCFDGVQWQLLGVYFSQTPTVPAQPAQPSGSGRSLQFAAPTYWTPGSSTWLQRTPSINTNRQVWTYSLFLKRPNPTAIPDVTGPWSNGQDSEMLLLYAGDDSAYRGDCTGSHLTGGPNGNFFMGYWASGFTNIFGQGTAPIGSQVRGTVNTWGVLMDSKWHHLMMTADGAHMSVYLDGVLIAQGATSGNGTINATRPHGIGAGLSDTGAPYWTNYQSKERMAEINFCDGQCLTWDKFAQNIGGIFIPKESPLLPGGAIDPGPNGFYLNWQNASAMTSTTLGKDLTVNQNNWQPTNFSAASILTDYPVLASAAGG